MNIGIFLIQFCGDSFVVLGGFGPMERNIDLVGIFSCCLCMLSQSAARNKSNRWNWRPI